MNIANDFNEWPEVTHEEFDETLSYQRYRRVGWGDCITYEGIFTGKTLAVVDERGKKCVYRLNPKGLHDA